MNIFMYKIPYGARKCRKSFWRFPRTTRLMYSGTDCKGAFRCSTSGGTCGKTCPLCTDSSYMKIIQHYLNGWHVHVMNYYLVNFAATMTMKSRFARLDLCTTHYPSTMRLIIGEEWVHTNISPSTKRCKFLARIFSFSSTSFHTSPSFMKWHGLAYALSAIHISCLQILARNCLRLNTTRRRLPSSKIWLLKARSSCVVKTKYLRYSSTFNIGWFLIFLG